MLSQDDAEEERGEFERIGTCDGIEKVNKLSKKKLRYCAGIAEW
jgi:hypothetical protein